MKKPNVLFVDDDGRVLNAWRRAFSQEPYNCLWARSGIEALSIVRRQPVHVVVTDYLMAGGNGVELLREIIKIAPHIVRIMVSGNANLTVAQQAINDGGVQLFFQKPCSVVQLGDALREALADIEQSAGTKSGMVELESKYPGISKVDRDERGVIKI